MKLYLVTCEQEQEVVYVVADSMGQIEAEWDSKAKFGAIDEIKLIDDEIIIFNNLKPVK